MALVADGVATSPAGSTWTQVPGPVSLDTVIDIAWGDGLFLAVGSAGTLFTSTDGSRFESGDTTFRGEQDFPLSKRELQDKYRWLANDILQPERVTAIENVVFELPSFATIQPLLDCLTPPPDQWP